MSTSLILPGYDQPETEPETIRSVLQHQVDLVIDGGAGGLNSTTVLDLTAGTPEIVRAGKGDVSRLIKAKG